MTDVSSRSVLAARFSPATAKRRVTTLLSWRAYVRDPQLPRDPSIRWFGRLTATLT